MLNICHYGIDIHVSYVLCKMWYFCTFPLIMWVHTINNTVFIWPENLLVTTNIRGSVYTCILFKSQMSPMKSVIPQFKQFLFLCVLFSCAILLKRYFFIKLICLMVKIIFLIFHSNASFSDLLFHATLRNWVHIYRIHLDIPFVIPRAVVSAMIIHSKALIAY